MVVLVGRQVVEPRRYHIPFGAHVLIRVTEFNEFAFCILDGRLFLHWLDGTYFGICRPDELCAWFWYVLDVEVLDVPDERVRE